MGAPKKTVDFPYKPYDAQGTGKSDKNAAPTAPNLQSLYQGKLFYASNKELFPSYTLDIKKDNPFSATELALEPSAETPAKAGLSAEQYWKSQLYYVDEKSQFMSPVISAKGEPLHDTDTPKKVIFNIGPLTPDNGDWQVFAPPTALNASMMTPPPTDDTPTIKPRTQKGIGLKVLGELFPDLTIEIRHVLQSPEQVETLSGFPYFARPAPSVAKHGYIDSRMVTTKEECAALLAQVLEDDPEGELLLCTFIENAALNVVWTPTALTFAKGHDGATAGKNVTVLPLAGAIHGSLSYVLPRAGLRPKEHPYIEAVLTKDPYVWLTQLRAGPAVPVGNYVPRRTVVETVVHADPTQYKDRAWERKMKPLAGAKGLVVWQPQGAMTSHFAIHAFANKIPIVFDATPPEKGAVLTRTDNAVGAFDPQAMLRGVVAGDKFKLQYKQESTGAAVHAMLLATHNATVMTGEYSKWVGMAAALMLRLGCVALTGEARHLNGTSPKAGRSEVYHRSLPYSLSRHRRRVRNLVNMFRYGAWGSSFGGKKWAYCGVATVGLFEAVRKLAQTPTEAAAAEVVKALNIAVNQAHNGGWWLNKFCDTSAFQLIQEGYVTAVLRACPILAVLDQIYASFTAEDLEKALADLRAWPVTDLQPPIAQSATITLQPDNKRFTIQLLTRLLKSNAKDIQVKLPSTVPKDVATFLTNNTFLLRTPHGYAVEVRGTDGTITTVWEDEALQEHIEDNQPDPAQDEEESE